MENIKCILCNYSTKRQDNYNRHIKSKKHSKKVDEVAKKDNSTKSCNVSRALPRTSAHVNTLQNISKHSDILQNTEIKKIICNNCGIYLSRQSSLIRHQKTCSKKNDEIIRLTNELEAYKKEKLYEDQIRALNAKLEKFESENNMYKKENKYISTENDYHKQMLNEAGGIVKKSVSALTYIMSNYGSAPTIEMLDIDDLENLEQNNKKLIEDVISAHKHKTLDKYLGDSIKTLYKKNNPKDQSVWSTDTSRLTYLIKELMVNNSSNWIIDKKGAKTKEYLIDPLLGHIKTIIIEYQENMSIGKDICEMEHNAEINKQILRLVTDIDDGIVGTSLLKYISSHLFFNEKLLK